MSDATAGGQGLAWQDEESSDLAALVRGLEGDEDAFRRLEGKSEALALFARAAAGSRKAFAALQAKAGDPLELDYLVATVVNADLNGLADRHPELPLLFGGIKGDADALRRLERKRPGLGKLARFVRDAYAREEEQAAAGGAAPEHLADGAAADVGCLVGEHHLARGDYAKAVEAFTRAIETNPSADEYEGRARAYRALAEADERAAQALRGDA
jgi:tetratricopeptide (TPR) repeat protein